MHTPSMDEILDALGPILDDLDTLIRQAHKRYRGYPADVLVEHCPRTAANCIYDHMAAGAERVFLNRTDIRLIDVSGLKLWLIDTFAAVRLKKMDEDGQSRNYPTEQARRFDRGEELPGLPAAPIRLTAGYLLDATGTEFIRTQIARPAGRRAMWCGAVVPLEARRPGQRNWVNVTRQGHL